MASTYEIFIQPQFRDNFDHWRETPLEQMDNRNVTEKEKKDAEERKNASLAMRRTAKKE